jgi:hypothetical protein
VVIYLLAIPLAFVDTWLACGAASEDTATRTKRPQLQLESRCLECFAAILPEPFGPAAVAAETNKRFRAHLKVLVDPRTASRRMLTVFWALAMFSSVIRIQIPSSGETRKGLMIRRPSRSWSC